MKKIICIIILASLSTVAFSQITPIKEIKEVSNFPFFVTNTNNMYCTRDTTQILILDENFNIAKTISGLPAFRSVAMVSKNMFTNSGKYEFILNLKNGEDKLYNEDKIMLYDFGAYVSWLVVNAKLVTYKTDMTRPFNRYDIKVFSLSGSAAMMEQKSMISQNAYPNPASSIINIIYTITNMQACIITDMSGNEISRILLDPYQNVFQLDVSGYHPGMYIYKYGSVTGKFVVQ